jgi:hypothetical protein
MPGHTPGLITMQVETQNSGHFMLNSDLYHVRDVFEQNLTQGWLGRDSHNWHRSHRWMKQLQHRYNATMIYGHDATVLEELAKQAKGIRLTPPGRGYGPGPRYPAARLPAEAALAACRQPPHRDQR